MKSLHYPTVDDRLLSEVVRKILEVGKPRLIVLFGSRARGEARPDSDLDLLIIEETTVPRHQRAWKYRQALVGLFPAKDVIIWTPEEVDEWRGVTNAFITTALREGKVLYER